MSSSVRTAEDRRVGQRVDGPPEGRHQVSSPQGAAWLPGAPAAGTSPPTWAEVGVGPAHSSVTKLNPMCLRARSAHF